MRHGASTIQPVDSLPGDRGSGPGQVPESALKQKADAPKKAVKCDMCKDLKGGAACVRACPTGAALRIKPDQLPAYAGER